MARSQTDKLAMMGNQIAGFFKAYPHEEAVAGTASHIEAFWTPRMIQTLKDAMPGRTDLDPLLVEALSPEVQAMDRAEKAELAPVKGAAHRTQGSQEVSQESQQR